MPVLLPGQTIESPEPVVTIEVDPQRPLRSGQYRIQLVVVDQEGNASDPAILELVVLDSQKPTAVIEGPRRVELGQSFILSGKLSQDVAPGRIVKWSWTMLG